VSVAGVGEPDRLVDQAGRRRDRCDAAQHRPLGFGGDPLKIVAGGDKQNRDGVGPDAVATQQFGCGGFDEQSDLFIESP
jgi:hypothetical protein